MMYNHLYFRLGGHVGYIGLSWISVGDISVLFYSVDKFRLDSGFCYHTYMEIAFAMI